MQVAEVDKFLHNTEVLHSRHCVHNGEHFSNAGEDVKSHNLDNTQQNGEMH